MGSHRGTETSQDGRSGPPLSDKWASRILKEDDAGPRLPATDTYFSGTGFILTGDRLPNELFLIKTR